MGVDSLFTRLSQRAGLEDLEIDIEPGLTLLPYLTGPNSLAAPFSTLERLHIMCYPEIALALLNDLPVIEELELDISRVPDEPVQESDHAIMVDLLLATSRCHHLRYLKIGLGPLASQFPSSESLPRLTGNSLVNLARHCPGLEQLNLFASEPSALDGSEISAMDFDYFCQSLPRLHSLILKLDPLTTRSLESTALSSLGRHCHELEVLRLRIPYQLTDLPVSAGVPHIVVSSPGTPVHEYINHMDSPTSFTDVGSDLASAGDVTPLFPRLTHLGIARPETILSTGDNSFADSISSYSTVVDPELEEDLVRSWAHALLTHFPRLEILEAWSDWTGQDNESLNYFLPTEEKHLGIPQRSGAKLVG
jgi:hypothetical protein